MQVGSPSGDAVLKLFPFPLAAAASPQPAAALVFAKPQHILITRLPGLFDGTCFYHCTSFFVVIFSPPASADTIRTQTKTSYRLRLLAPPSLCSMTRSSRLPALTSRWKTVAARLALAAEPMLNVDTIALLDADSALGPDAPLLAVVGCAGREALLFQGLGRRCPPPRRCRGR